jgi:hypothetical protein
VDQRHTATSQKEHIREGNPAKDSKGANNSRFSLQGGGHDHDTHLGGVKAAIKLFASFYGMDIRYLVDGTI